MLAPQSANAPIDRLQRHVALWLSQDDGNLTITARARVLNTSSIELTLKFYEKPRLWRIQCNPPKEISTDPDDTTNFLLTCSLALAIFAGVLRSLRCSGYW